MLACSRTRAERIPLLQIDYFLARFDILNKSASAFDKITNDDSIAAWNSAMIGYFRGIHFSEALGFYLNLKRRKIRVENSTIVFALRSCVELGIHEFGLNLHSECFKFGWNRDRFVCSSLIGFYSKFDQNGDACKVFDEMPHRDLVAYTSIISAYARLGDDLVKGAFRVVLEMQSNGFDPNRVTLISLLQCALRLGELKKVKSIHGYAVRNGIGCGDEIFETCLMDTYVKLGDVCNGCMVFDAMQAKSVPSWNALISGFLRLGQPFEALNIFNRMVSEKHELDLVSLVNGLMIAANLGNLHLGKEIHCCVLRKGVDLDLVGMTGLIDMYAKCRHLLGAVNVFNGMNGKDSILYSVMVAGYLHNGFVLKAMETFREMAVLGVETSVSVVIHVLSALSDLEDARAGKSVHGFVFRQEIATKTDIANQLISMYSKCGLIQYARRVFDGASYKDRVSWTSMMTGLVGHGLGHAAIAMFRLMQREHISPDSVTFICLIQAANHLNFATQVREVHGYLFRTTTFLDSDITLMNMLITAYSKWGKLEMARNIFDCMSERHLSTWNTMIAAYGMNGDCVKALELFDQMKKIANLCLDNITFKSVLSACSHAGFVKEGLETFDSMEAQGVTPSDEHYGCVVDLLGRAGWLEEAYEVVKRAPSRSTLGALLGACRIYGDSEMGERVGKWLLEAEMGSMSAYCSVANFYAGHGRWEAAAAVGAVAEEKGLRRLTGCSVVGVN